MILAKIDTFKHLNVLGIVNIDDNHRELTQLTGVFLSLKPVFNSKLIKVKTICLKVMQGTLLN